MKNRKRDYWKPEAKQTRQGIYLMNHAMQERIDLDNMRDERRKT